MASSALEAEATGQRTVTARYDGVDFELPTDVEDWPLPLVAASLGFNAARQKVSVNNPLLLQALTALLGEQWKRFVQAFPTRRHWVPASHVFAAAVGFPKPPLAATGRPVDDFFDAATQVFGGLPRLLTILDRWPDQVESDLDRFWNLDYRDRWRFDETGCRKLTLRQINVRLSNLPATSAIAIAMGRRTPTELLLMDVYEAIARRPHIDRPLTAEQLAERRKQVDQAAGERRAKEDYRRRHKLGGIETARTNAQRSGKAPAHA